jgi:hypothetical protein
MKKVLVIFILLLLAVPAMATITVTATCSGTASPYTVTVSYSIGTGDTLPPRAFGLLVSTSAGTIGTVTPVTTNYYVAPGSFNYDGTTVTTWGNPIVTKTNTSFILEVGSLYASNDPSHTTAPPTSGTLLSFQLTAPANTVVSIAADSARGGVVREDPSVTGNVTLTGCTTQGVTYCFPSTSDYSAQFAAFKSYKSYVTTWDGACWCGGTKWKYQCSGDANGDTQITGVNYRVYTNDLGVLSANWKKKISDPTINPCADVDHKSQITGVNYRVYTNDLARVSANWKKKDSQLPVNCPIPDAQN